MTSTVSCTDSDKERFEAFQESGETQSETFSRILDMAEAFEGDIIDESEVAEQTAELIGPKLELAMKRVSNEMKGEIQRGEPVSIGWKSELSDGEIEAAKERVREELEYNE